MAAGPTGETGKATGGVRVHLAPRGRRCDSGRLSVPLGPGAVGGLPGGSLAPDPETQPPAQSGAPSLLPEISGSKQNKKLIHCFQSYRKFESFILLPLEKKKSDQKKNTLHVLEELRTLLVSCGPKHRSDAAAAESQGNGQEEMKHITIKHTRS